MNDPPFRAVVPIAMLYIATVGLEIVTARVLGTALELIPGVVVALGLILGPVAAVGAAAGYVSSQLLLGTLTVYSSVGFVTQFVLALAPAILWRQFGRLPSGGGSRRSDGYTLAGFVLAGSTVAALVAALTALGAAVFGRSTFSVVAADVVVETLGSILLIGGTVAFLSAWLKDHDIAPTWVFALDWPPATRSGSPATGLVIGPLSVLWLSIGYGIDIVFQAVDIENPQLLVNNVDWWVLTVRSLAGPGGVYLQAALGVAFGGVSLTLLFSSCRGEGVSRPNTDVSGDGNR